MLGCPKVGPKGPLSANESTCEEPAMDNRCPAPRRRGIHRKTSEITMSELGDSLHVSLHSEEWESHHHSEKSKDVRKPEISSQPLQIQVSSKSLPLVPGKSAFDSSDIRMTTATGNSSFSSYFEDADTPVQRPQRRLSPVAKDIRATIGSSRWDKSTPATDYKPQPCLAQPLRKLSPMVQVSSDPNPPDLPVRMPQRTISKPPLPPTNDSDSEEDDESTLPPLSPRRRNWTPHLAPLPFASPQLPERKLSRDTIASSVHSFADTTLSSGTPDECSDVSSLTTELSTTIHTMATLPHDDLRSPQRLCDGEASRLNVQAPMADSRFAALPRKSGSDLRGASPRSVLDLVARRAEMAQQRRLQRLIQAAQQEGSTTQS